MPQIDYTYIRETITTKPTNPLELVIFYTAVQERILMLV